MLIRSLRAFLAVSRCGTVAAAARQVHLSSAAVSVQLKNMEEELGVALFERTRRSLRLTAAGRQLVPLAEQMVGTYQQMKALGDNGPLAGTLTLGVINSALTGVLPSLLRRIALDHSGLEIRVIAGISGDLTAQVESGVLDAAIVTQPSRRAGESLSFHPLYTEPFVLIMPSSVRYTGLSDVLASLPYIAFDRSTWAGSQIEEYLARRGMQARPAMELNALDAVTAVVSEGLGVSIVPLIRGTTWHQSPRLRVVRLTGFDRAVALAERQQHPRQRLTAALRAVFEEGADPDPARPEAAPARTAINRARY